MSVPADIQLERFDRAIRAARSAIQNASRRITQAVDDVHEDHSRIAVGDVTVAVHNLAGAIDALTRALLNLQRIAEGTSCRT